jgi:hypothetical protein
MLLTQRRTASSLIRSAAYIRSNSQTLGVLEDTPDFRTLAAAVDRIPGLERARQSVPLARRANQQDRTMVRQQLMTNYLAPLTAFARARRKKSPGYAAFSRLPSARGGKKFVAEVHAMATAATPFIPDLTAARFAPGFIASMTTLADRLDALYDAEETHRADSATSGETLRQTLAAGRAAVAALDPVVKHLLGDSAAIAGWNLARRVNAITASDGVVVPLPLVPPSTPEVKAA